MNHKTDADTTIDEIHEIRRRLAAKFDGEIKAIAEDARQRQAASGHPVWKRRKTATATPQQSDDQ